MRRFRFLLIILPVSLIWVFSFNALAQSQYTIKEMTPEIESALENRRQRYEQMTDLKTQGFIGENNKGYLSILREDKEVEEFVEAENRDRKMIYLSIAQQNNLLEAIETIEKVFAHVQRDKAHPGDKIQNEDGQWIVKESTQDN